MLLVKTRIGPSAIQGIGVFAAEFIPKGTVIWRFQPGFDVLITPEIEAQLSRSALEQVRKYAYIDVDTGEKILCSDDSRFFNHSDLPNAGIDPDRPDREIDVALRDIVANEELTCDYRTFDADSARELDFSQEAAQ